MHTIKKEIIEVIEKNEGAFYGFLVKEIRQPREEILKHLLDLKAKGLVYKDNDGGQFKMVPPTISEN
jgi:DNA-binding IclR family transcriptional regulator